MNEVKNIYQRIIAIMAEVDYIQKGEKKAGNIYKYVSHDAVSEKLHPYLVKHGVAVIPSVKSMTRDGNMTIACVTMKFVNIDNPEDFFISEGYGYGIDSGDKGPGKSISYATKYIMLKTFVLETGDDPDHEQDAVHIPDPKPVEKPKEPIPSSPPSPPKLITHEQHMQLLEELEEYDELHDRILKAYKIKNLEEIEWKGFDSLLQRIRKEKAKK